MNTPTFTAEKSLYNSSEHYVPTYVHTSPLTGEIYPALLGNQFTRSQSFSCNAVVCACQGDADCNDMFTTNLCSGASKCYDDVCWCVRN
jgi:hypothetical protein